MNREQKVSESFLLGVFLTLAGGFLDAYSYVARGKVFATAETGNIVLMGLNLAQGNFGKALYYVVPITSWAVGVLAAEQVRLRCREEEARIHWRQIVLLLEAAILAAVAFIPQGGTDIAANSLVAFICAMQVESFRRVNGNAYATTMCTGNLRSGMEHVHRFLFEKERASGRAAVQYFGIIGTFVVGAMIGVLCAGRWGARAVLVCDVFLLAAFGILFAGREK